MIRRDDLLEAIAECKGKKNPNASTCVKLASYLTILQYMGEDERTEQYSSSNYSYAESEFMQKISTKNLDEIVEIFAEVMDTLEVISPKLYQGIMRRL